MLHVISIHRLDDPRQTADIDLSKVIPCLVVLRFEHSTFVVRAEQLNHSVIVSYARTYRYIHIYLIYSSYQHFRGVNEKKNPHNLPNISTYKNITRFCILLEKTSREDECNFSVSRLIAFSFSVYYYISFEERK